MKKAAAKTAVASFPEELDNGLKALRTTGDKLEDAFWQTCALAYFEEARKAKHLEAAAYHLRQSLGEPEVVSWIASHRPAVDAFQKWSEAWAGKGCRPGK